MHDPNSDLSFDINLEEISKIEGAASLDIKVVNNQIADLKFSISEWKRFYTQGVRGKPAVAVPQLVARICGTCSNAHLLASIEAVEKAFNIIPSDQTMILRKLLYYGLIIRDHALHLYIFSLPDVYNKKSILDFEENDPIQHQLLDDTFAVKEVGNQLSIVIGGRSVHAPQPTVGGFLKLPNIADIKNLKEKIFEIRPRVLKLIEIFGQSAFELKPDFPVVYTSLISPDFSFLEGNIETSDGKAISEKDLGTHLDAVIIPYSHARGFKFDGNMYLVGALARLNLSKNFLNPKTKKDIQKYLDLFPSNNLFHNNLAQAIEMLHAIDESIRIIDSLEKIEPESPISIKPFETTGIGVIEAPRGTLFYELNFNADGAVKKAEIIVPTGQNQVIMEKAIYQLVNQLLKKETNKEEIIDEVEKLIRAFDPCMSCAAHFLKVKWK